MSAIAFVGVGIDGAAVALFRGHLRTNTTAPVLLFLNSFVLLLVEVAVAITFVGISLLMSPCFLSVLC